MMTSPLWQISLTLPVYATGLFMDALEELADSTSCFEDRNKREWHLTLYMQNEPDLGELHTRLAILCDIANIPCPVPQVEYLAGTDWVAESQKNFQPVRSGRFYVHPHWHPAEESAGVINLQIDPQRAFGTGGHYTTFGCLEALSRLATLTFSPQQVLDLGSGTGILAMAAKKLWPEAIITATDIDPVAVEICENNARLNHIAMAVLEADGYQHPFFSDTPLFDLIIANILALPLINLAEENARHLKQGGYIILAGLLKEQESDVLAAYQAQGFSVAEILLYDEWPTLVLEKKTTPL